MSLTKLLDNKIYIHEIYASIQGETTFAGIPTVFVRLSACNLRCTWCDTPQAFSRGNPLPISEIIEKVKAYKLQHICITGGEPLLQKDVHTLMRALCDQEFTVSIETGGSLPIKEIDERVVTILDIKCPGSGMDSKNLWKNLEQLKEKDQVKFVLADRNDYDYAKEICEKFSLYLSECPLLMSPVHNVLNPQQLIDWILSDQIPVRVNVQIHKYIWSPETLGV